MRERHSAQLRLATDAAALDNGDGQEVDRFIRLAVDDPAKYVDGAAPELFFLEGHGRQRGIDIARDQQIVHTDDRHILRDTQPVLLHAADEVDGKRVAGAQKRGRQMAGLQQLLDEKQAQLDAFMSYK